MIRALTARQFGRVLAEFRGNLPKPGDRVDSVQLRALSALYPHSRVGPARRQDLAVDLLESILHTCGSNLRVCKGGVLRPFPRTRG